MDAHPNEYEDFVYDLVRWHQMLRYYSMEVSQTTGCRDANGELRRSTSVSITKEIDGGLQLMTTTTMSQKGDSKEHSITSTISLSRPRSSGPAWFLTISVGKTVRWFIDGDKNAAKRDIMFLKLTVDEDLKLDEYHSDVKIIPIN